MAYKQYTQCVQPAGYSGLAPGLIAAAIAAVVLLLIGVGWGAIGVAAVLALMAYCEWWLYRRLICLGGDRCALGLLVATHPPANKSGFDAFDTDYSIDLLLWPNGWPGADDVDILASVPQGVLIREHENSRNLGLPFRGEFTDVPLDPQPGSKRMVILHAEFEGGGVQTLYDAAKIAMVPAAIGAATCWIPIIGWILCIVLGLITAAILGIAAAVALGNTGDPTDVNPALDQLHPMTDVLIVTGTWVYDSAHEGWNEIHPIKQAQRVDNWAHWVTVPRAEQEANFERWCEALGTARDPLTRGEQAKPEHQWTVHPVVDGCTPAPGGEPNEAPH
jgi:hypothetical protein